MCTLFHGQICIGDMIDYTDNVKISEENGKPKINFKENNSETNM